MNSFPLSRVENSQPEGIGRVVSLRSGAAWNNLGRNVVFADGALRPVAVFGDTMFPDDDEPSQYDLDVHAIVELAETGTVAVLNHYGTIRIFDSPWSVERGLAIVEPNLAEQRRLEFVDDIERVVGLGDRLVTSRPRGKRQDGILVTEPLPGVHDHLSADPAHESFGFVSALAASAISEGTGRVALGGDGCVRLVEAERGRLGATRWEVSVDFLVSVLIESGSSLWAAGSVAGSADVDDYQWDQLRGGGLVELDLKSGSLLTSAGFGEDLAWGSGGVPLVLIDGLPCAVGRRGELQVLAPGAAETARLTEGLPSPPLGIAHAAVVGDQLVIGFNRGGYRLHVTRLPSLRRMMQHPSLRRA
ncbi:MAG: hypothetical protein WB565_06290 [Acidimicrobiales bacterium]